MVNLTNIWPFTEQSGNFQQILSKKVLIQNSQNQDFLARAYILPPSLAHKFTAQTCYEPEEEGHSEDNCLKCSRFLLVCDILLGTPEKRIHKVKFLKKVLNYHGRNQITELKFQGPAGKCLNQCNPTYDRWTSQRHRKRPAVG